jgi:hypothetical protein
MAIAFRPRPTASSITSRYGPHALAAGARPGFGHAESVDTPSLVAGFAVPESVDPPPVVAGFAVPESVDTPPVVAGFGGHSDRRPPTRRTATPAARR